MVRSRRQVTAEDRLRIARLIDEGHSDPELVAEVFGVSRSSVYDWLRKYREGGPEALRRSVPLGRPSAISEHQMRNVYSLIRDHEPREFGFGYALWTRSVVGLLVQQEFDLQLSPPTLAKALDRLGLRVPREVLRSIPCRPESGQSRQFDTLLRGRSAQVGANLLFGAVTWPDNNDASGPGGHRDHALLAVDGRGHARFSVSSGHLNAARLIEFGTGLVHDCPLPTYVVLPYRAGCDLSGVRQFVDGTNGRLGVFLPRHGDDDSTAVEFWCGRPNQQKY